jgi:competence protein ComEC
VLLTAGLIALLLWFSRKPADPMPASKLDVFVLDAGQGDAILLHSEGHFALLDSGDTDGGSRLVQRLHAMGVRQLDFAVISHPHSDHMGGMAQVLAEFGAQRLYQPEIPAELLPTVYSYEHLLKTAQEHNIPVTVPHCGDTLTLGAAAVQFLSVENSAFEDLNDCSLGCLVTCGSHRFLFCGDLEKAGESAMLSAGLIPRVSVLKLSHHGSASSTSEAFLAAASPQIAVISVGAMNDYGHPAEQTLARLKAAGTAVYRTDLSGTLRLATDGEQLIVQTNAE